MKRDRNESSVKRPHVYGLFGVGRVGIVHGKILHQLGHTIICIGDESADAVKDAKQKLSLPEDCETFTDPQAMANACSRLGVEFVVVASHTRRHARDGMPFVAKGVRVYMENSLCSYLDEAFEFCMQIESLGSRNKVVQIGLQRRFDEATLYGRDLLRRGLIGQVREIKITSRDQFPPPATYTSRGLLIDMGISAADEAIDLLKLLDDDAPVRVQGQVFSALYYKSLCDEGGNTAFVTFESRRGIIGRLDLSRTHSAGFHNETVIIGNKGVLSIGRFCGYPHGKIPVELWTDQGVLSPESRTFEMTKVDEVSFPEFLPRWGQALTAAHKAFLEAAESGSPFRVGQDDVLRAQVFVEVAHMSACNGGNMLDIPTADNLRDFRALCQDRGLF